MAKWADYIITAVWKRTNNNTTYISHVLLHIDNGESVSNPGIKKGKDEVIQLIQQGNTIITATWNYSSSAWSKGEVVGTININGETYLRTHRDDKTTDNLDNLLSGKMYS